MTAEAANKHGAFLPDHIVVEGAASGPLKGRTFAAKDLYDVRPSSPPVCERLWSCLPGSPPLQHSGEDGVCQFDTGSGARHGLWQPHMGRNPPSSDNQRAGSSGAVYCTLNWLRTLSLTLLIA
jgi:hypothetical protein